MKKFYRYVLLMVLATVFGCADTEPLQEENIGSSAQAVAVARAWTMVDAGKDHTCALMSTGRDVYCWGKNNKGQVGDGTTTNRTTPVVVSGDYSSVAGGGDVSCAISYPLGLLYCWGDNSYKQIADTATAYYATPQQVSISGASYPLKSVAVGIHNVCVIDQNYQGLCWGSGSLGMLGSGAPAITHTAYQIPSTDGWDSQLTMIALDKSWSESGCGVGLDGDMKCWGDNTNLLTPGGANPNWNATYVSSLMNFVPTSIAVCQTACATRAGSNQPRCWGYDWYANFGASMTGYPEYDAYQTAAPMTTSGTDYTASPRHTCGRTFGFASNRVYCWGATNEGQVGAGVTDPTLVYIYPQSVTGLSTTLFKTSLTSGDAHTCVLQQESGSSNYFIWCWGRNSSGQLGDGTTTLRNVPTKVDY